jgi:hypothetical protein
MADKARLSDPPFPSRWAKLHFHPPLGIRDCLKWEWPMWLSRADLRILILFNIHVNMNVTRVYCLTYTKYQVFKQLCWRDTANLLFGVQMESKFKLCPMYSKGMILSRNPQWDRNLGLSHHFNFQHTLHNLSERYGKLTAWWPWVLLDQKSGFQSDLP